MMNQQLSFFLCTILFIGACSTDKRSISVPSTDRNRSIDVRYAERFQVSHIVEGVKLLTIDKPWKGSKKGINYLLYTDTIPELYRQDDAYITVKTPVNTIVSNLTTQLALMEQLHIDDRLIGFAQTKYIYSPHILSRVSKHQVKEIGPDGSLDIESILDLDPDIFLSFSTHTENRQLQKLQELGMKVVMNAGYMEASVLGRFEWIKFIGHFTGTEHLATQIFDEKVIVYDSLLRLVAGQHKPKVMIGTLYGGTWFMPAGQNYGANIVSAAGGDYLWAADEHEGWLNLDFESVYDRAHDADYWIGVGSYTSLEALKQADERYASFRSFKTGQVYTYMERVNHNGANDYFESGNANPDRLLADHIKILHPELLPGYELYYYMKLE